MTHSSLNTNGQESSSLRMACAAVSRIWIIGCFWVVVALGRSDAADPLRVPANSLTFGSGKPSLRWDNVEKRPYWIDGSQPALCLRDQLHYVGLQPGHTVTLRIPAYEMVRVLGTSDLSGDDLQIWISNGSGLFLRHEWAYSDDHSLICAPNSPDVSMVRIVRPPSAKGSIQGAIFVSRHVAPPSRLIGPKSYASQLPTQLQAVRLRHCDSRRTEEYYHASPGRSFEVELDGPLCGILISRIRYPDWESQTFQTYRMELRIDGRPSGCQEIDTTADTRNHWSVDGRTVIVSVAETTSFSIPPGPHRVTIDCTAGAYLQLHTMETDNFLVPSLNFPESPAENLIRESIWSTSITSGRNPLSPIAQDIQIALRLARDNRYRDGGMTAVMQLLPRAAQSEDRELIRHLDSIRRFHTRFRDLIPSTNIRNGLERKYFCLSQLGDATSDHEKQPPFLVHPQFEQELWGRLPVAMFGELQELPEVAPQYFLTNPTSVGSEVRLVVELLTESQGSRFVVQLDDGQLYEFMVSAEPYLRETDYISTLSSAALQRLTELSPNWLTGTLTGRFSQHGEPGPLARTATWILNLPATARSLRVWQTNTQGPHLRLAVQERVSQNTKLSEYQYLELQRRNPSISDWGPETFQGRMVGSPCNWDFMEWQNDVLPLLRKLHNLQERFFHSITQPKPQAVIRTLTESERIVLIDRAERMIQQNNWIVALECWSQLERTSADPLREKWRLRQADALQHLGETYLAEQVLKGLLRYAQENEIREEAIEMLDAIYASARDLDALERLWGAVVSLNPTFENMNQLASVFLQNGSKREALQLLLMSPAASRNPQIEAHAALQNGWWYTMDEALGRMTDTHLRDYWKGIRAIAMGDLCEAKQWFLQSSSSGVDFAQHIVVGEELRSRIDEFKSEKKNSLDEARAWSLVAEWGEWLRQHPGPRKWERNDGHLVEVYGSAQVSSPQQTELGQYYRVGPRRTMRTLFVGPLKLRVEFRPLHDPNAFELLDDWVRIRTETRHHLVPITANYPASTLSLVDGVELPGVLVSEELEFGPGIHEIQIEPTKYPMLARIHVERPTFLVPVLPPLTMDTVQALVGKNASSVPALESELNPPPHAVQAVCLANGDVESALNVPVGDDTVAVRQRMSILTWQFETADGADPKRFQQLLVMGESTFIQHPEVDGMARLHSRLTRRASWQPFRAIARSAGIQEHAIVGWTPESPELRVRGALLPSLAQGDHVLTGATRLVLNFAAESPDPSGGGRQLKLNLQQLDLPYCPCSRGVVGVQVDQEPTTLSRIGPTDDSASITLNLPAGSHSVAIWLEEPAVNQFVKVSWDQAELGNHNSTGSSETWIQDRSRLYTVATHTDPIHLVIDGPTFLRVDERRGSDTLCHYYWSEQGKERIELKPPANEPFAMYRIFELKLDLEKPVPSRRWDPQDEKEPSISETPEPTLVRLVQHTEASTSSDEIRDETRIEELPTALAVMEGPRHSAVQILALQPAPTWIEPLFATSSRWSPTYDELPLGGQEDGTWLFSSSLVSRRPLEEGGQVSAPDQFWGISATHRFFDPTQDHYQATEIQFRLRESSGPSWAVQQRHWWHPWHVPGTVVVEGSFFAQHPTDPIIAGTDTTEFAILGQLRWYEFYRIGHHLSHVPSISTWGRFLSLHAPRYAPGHVDQDLFTIYKSDHRNGLRLADTITLRPWLDNQIWLRPEWVTNENFDVTRPDHFALRTGVTQALGSVELELSYRITRFRADENRKLDSIQHLLYLNLLGDGWYCGGRRYDWDLNLQYDVVDSQVGAQFTVSCYWDRGRQQIDLHPSQREFPSLHAQRHATGWSRAGK